MSTDEIRDYAKRCYDSVRMNEDGSMDVQDKCWRCCNGTYYWGASVNGSRGSYSGPCYRCGGGGWDKPKHIKDAAKWYKRKLKADAKKAEQIAEYEAQQEAIRIAKLPQKWAKAMLLIRAEQGEVEARRLAAERSEWIGEEKERREFTGELRFARAVASDFGMSRLYSFKCGNAQVKCFWSGKPFDIERGDIVTFKATVKRHDEYKGVKQTMVNRMKIINVERNDENSGADERGAQGEGDQSQEVGGDPRSE